MTAKFLIEIPHQENVVACSRVVEVFLRSGSHFLSNADWGCKDGVHKAWIVVDVESRNEARGIIPPAFRADAKIVQLNMFSLEEGESILRGHEQ